MVTMRRKESRCTRMFIHLTWTCTKETKRPFSYGWIANWVGNFYFYELMRTKAFWRIASYPLHLVWWFSSSFLPRRLKLRGVIWNFISFISSFFRKICRRCFFQMTGFKLFSVISFVMRNIFCRRFTNETNFGWNAICNCGSGNHRNSLRVCWVCKQSTRGSVLFLMKICVCIKLNYIHFINVSHQIP